MCNRDSSGDERNGIWPNGDKIFGPIALSVAHLVSGFSEWLGDVGINACLLGKLVRKNRSVHHCRLQFARIADRRSAPVHKFGGGRENMFHDSRQRLVLALDSGRSAGFAWN